MLWLFLPALAKADDGLPTACPLNEGFNTSYTHGAIDPYGSFKLEVFVFKIGSFTPTNAAGTAGYYSFGDITSQSQKSVLRNAFLTVHCTRYFDADLNRWVIDIWDDGSGGHFEWFDKFDESADPGEDVSFSGPSSGDGGTATSGGQHGNWLLYESCLYTVWYRDGVEVYRELEYCWVG